MNKLNKLYEAMLKSWGCIFNEESAISLNFSGNIVPVQIDEKQMYLATSENLNGVTIGKVFFHPACESIMSKETEVFKVIRKLTTAKIFSVFQPIADVLFSVASKKSGKTLTGKMLETLEPFKAASKNVRQEVTEILKMISITLEDNGMDTRLINFSMIKGGKNENDEPIYYTATPSFPFYTELYRAIAQNEGMKTSDRMGFGGLSVSMAAMKIVAALFELALPACLDPSRNKYSVTTQDAARLVAYLHSYGLVAADMNSLIGKFRKEFDSIGIYGIDLEWLSELDEIGDIKKLIPALDYNNYNTTSSPETPATGSVGARISSFNPLSGLMNTSSGTPTISQGSANVPATAPKIPDTLPGENYIGCDYSQSNGIYEYKFQQSNGMIRVRRLAEDGRFINEDFTMPQQQMPQMVMAANGMMVPMQQPQMVMAPNGMMMPMNPAMMGSGIPLLGMGNGMQQGGMVQDRYTGQWVQSNGQVPMNNVAPAPVNNGFNNNGGFDMGMAGINQY